MAFAAVQRASQDFTGQGQKEMAATALGESKSPRKGKCYSKGVLPSHGEEKKRLPRHVKGFNEKTKAKDVEKWMQKICHELDLNHFQKKLAK